MYVRTDHWNVKNDIGRPITKPTAPHISLMLVRGTPETPRKAPRTAPMTTPSKPPPTVAMRKNNSQLFTYEIVDVCIDAPLMMA
jgi:hypothetical protein